jgi:release factor glutamine methyltransferase
MRNEPVQYVTGKAYFRRLALSVTPDVLIPRKETELVAQKAIDLIREHSFAAALDMCTGSGCIAISLATETPAAVEACDISEKALVIARRNALNNGAAVRFFTSDMFSNADRSYDLIVCNPPYVSEEEYDTLTPDVRDHEPRLALVAEDDGYAFYRRIASEAPQHLNEGGMLVLEIGAQQARGVMTLLKRNFEAVERYKDYEGRNRIVTARKKQVCHV